MRIEKNKQLISSVDDWFKYAPPKNPIKQWVDGRSAKECAKAWFPRSGELTIPSELQDLLESHPDIGKVDFREAEPEVVVKLDNFRGETRNADLEIFGKYANGEILISIEAKADEEFGPTLEKELNSVTSPRSKIPERVDNLCLTLFGRPFDSEPSLNHLRYQLLTASAGALVSAKAKGASVAVLCVHEFQSSKTQTEKLKRNANDYSTFLHCILGYPPTAVEPAMLYGPLHIRGGGILPKDIPLYIGKIARKV